jgi:hypothetical protein
MDALTLLLLLLGLNPTTSDTDDPSRGQNPIGG